ncbi:MAG: hypothetical protein ABFS86_12730 [Planctomycetota bacterium]
MRTAVAAIAALTLLCVLAGPANAQVHENKKMGYRISHPKKWTQVPIKSGEQWIVGKYLSAKDYTDHSEEFASSYRPEMLVILFPDAVTKDRGVERSTDGDDTFIRIKNPYRDYEHYLDENLHEGGWHISLKEEKKGKNLSWTLIEAKIDKLTYGGKKRLIAGVFHADDADYVVQFIILEADYQKKLKKEVYACLRSFKFIAREGSIARSSSGRVERVDEWDMTPKERKKYREERQAAAFRKAKEGLPRGWISFEYKGVYIISHVDRKDAMKVATLAVALMAWLEKTFDYLGDEAVRKPIIRICASSDERSAYQSGSGGWWSSDSREIVTYVDPKSFSMDWTTESLNEEIMNDWFRDKDRYARYWSLPSWLRRGLDEYVGGAKLKGSKVVFKNDAWGKDELRMAARKGELYSINDLITLTGEDFMGKWHVSDQCGALVRFFLEGPGAKSKKGKVFLEKYITGLRSYRKEIEEKEGAEFEKRLAEGPEDEEGKSEEELEKEEEERMKKSAEDWREHEAETLKALFERAFGEWSDKDWNKLERSFRAWLE